MKSFNTDFFCWITWPLDDRLAERLDECIDMEVYHSLDACDVGRSLSVNFQIGVNEANEYYCS